MPGVSEEQITAARQMTAIEFLQRYYQQQRTGRPHQCWKPWMPVHRCWSTSQYRRAGIWVSVVVLIAFVIIFLMNFISGRKMKNIGRW